MSILGKLARTEADLSALVLRLALAAVIFPHGAQKMLGWYGGHGFAATLEHFSEKLVIPTFLTVLVIAAEFVGPILLAVGLFGRLAALSIGVVIGTAMTYHIENGFFMNWFGEQKGEGYEYHILVVAMSLALLIKGSGFLSIDRVVGKSR